jgi:hypothetical protein
MGLGGYLGVEFRACLHGVVGFSFHILFLYLYASFCVGKGMGLGFVTVGWSCR